MKNFNIMGVHWKTRFLGCEFTKNQYIGGIAWKGRSWTVYRFKGGAGGFWEKREGWCFYGGLIPQCTLRYIKKDPFKAIKKKSKLRNNYLKNKSDANRMLYKKQRNYCVSLLRKSKTCYCAKLDEKKVSDNKLFWKVIKLSLSDKLCVKEQIHLVKKF